MANEMIIERSVIINKPKDEVFQFLQFTRNQEKFSVWNLADPDKQVATVGIDGQPGYIYSWDSKKKNVGKGQQEIKSISPDLIEYEIRFEKPMKNTAVSKFLLAPIEENQTKVVWDFRGPVKFPLSLFKSAFEKMLGKDIQAGLDNLKQLLENQSQ